MTEIEADLRETLRSLESAPPLLPQQYYIVGLGLRAARQALQLLNEMEGQRKALALFNAGMESACEQLDALKQETRALRAERDRLAEELRQLKQNTENLRK